MNFINKFFKPNSKQKQPSDKNQVKAKTDDQDNQPAENSLHAALKTNRALLEDLFDLPTNKDIVIRDFTITNLHRQALIVYIDGLTNSDTQNFAVLQPLMLLYETEIDADPITAAYQKIVPSHQAHKTDQIDEIVNAILDGDTVLLIDGSSEGMIIETKGWNSRSVERPITEPAIRGPQEGFTEHIRSNTASVRRYLKDPKLITEMLRIGRRSNTLVAIMYIKDIANPKLVDEVKRRLKVISKATDYIAETGSLEEYLEDHPHSLIPQIIATERPDRLSAYIREGFVGLVMANSPFSLIIPTNFTIFLHAAEDYYLRWPFGNFLRLIRTGSLLIALLLPGLYVAASSYHQEMIPTSLLLSMTAAHLPVPFPVLIEILFMEISFELIREAGIRVPGLIGSTIGLVGALILGQAAIDASIASPITIIVVAISGLASFVIPNYNAGFTIRILRFAFILLGGFMGFLGIAFGLFLLFIHMVNLTSFGVPFLAPIAPYYPKDKDKVLRPRAYNEKQRPTYLNPIDWIRQDDKPRRWEHAPDNQNNEGADSDEG